MLEYKYLKAFLLVAQQRNFSKAAAQLRVAPSAVTRQIQLFEESVGREVFLRSPKGVLLTQFGKQLFERFNEVDAWGAKLIEGKAVSLPPLRIGCLQSVFECALGPLLAETYVKETRALDISINLPGSLREDLREDRLDLICVNAPVNDGILSSRKMYRERAAVVGARANIDQKPAVRPVVYAPYGQWWEELENGRLRDFFVSRPHIRINSLNAALDLVKRGAGIAIVPEGPYIDQQHLVRMNHLVSKKILEEGSWIYAVTLAWKRPSSDLRTLIQRLSE